MYLACYAFLLVVSVQFYREQPGDYAMLIQAAVLVLQCLNSLLLSAGTRSHVTHV